MPMYNLIEYSRNYSKTSGRLWKYYRKYGNIWKYYIERIKIWF